MGKNGSGNAWDCGVSYIYKVILLKHIYDQNVYF